MDQLGLFTAPAPHPVVEKLKGLDPNHLTPMQALQLLAQMVDEVRENCGA